MLLLIVIILLVLALGGGASYPTWGNPATPRTRDALWVGAMILVVLVLVLFLSGHRIAF